MKGTPLVSVLLPTYQQPELLRRALRSVLAQDYPQMDVLVSDDSTDDAVERVVAQEQDTRVRYHRNAGTLGPAQNWNRAMDVARGRYIKFMHHDDWFDTPSSLATLVGAATSSGSDFVFAASSATRLDGSRKNVNRATAADVSSLEADPSLLLRRGNLVGAPSATLFASDERVRFDPRLQWLVDIDFYITYVRLHPRVEYVDQVLVHTTTDGAHQVTTISERRAEVELYEWDAVYRKQCPSEHWARLRTLIDLSMTYGRLGHPRWRRQLPASTRLAITTGQYAGLAQRAVRRGRRVRAALARQGTVEW